MKAISKATAQAFWYFGWSKSQDASAAQLVGTVEVSSKAEYDMGVSSYSFWYCTFLITTRNHSDILCPSRIIEKADVVLGMTTLHSLEANAYKEAEFTEGLKKKKAPGILFYLCQKCLATINQPQAHWMSI